MRAAAGPAAGGDLEVRASFALSYDSRDEAEQLAFRMLGLLAADFPAWNLAAVLDTDEDEAERLLEQLADAALADIAGVDATGLIRYRLHDLLRDFARERLHGAEAKDSLRARLARLAREYTGAAELAAALVHPGAHGSTGTAAEAARRGRRARRPVGLARRRARHPDRAGRAGARGGPVGPGLAARRGAARHVRLARRLARLGAHPAARPRRRRRSADTTAQARTLRSLGSLYRELGRYDEAVTLLTQAAGHLPDHGDGHHWATAMRNLGDTYRYQGRLTERSTRSPPRSRSSGEEEDSTVGRRGAQRHGRRLPRAFPLGRVQLRPAVRRRGRPGRGSKQSRGDGRN